MTLYLRIVTIANIPENISEKQEHLVIHILANVLTIGGVNLKLTGSDTMLTAIKLS